MNRLAMPIKFAAKSLLAVAAFFSVAACTSEKTAQPQEEPPLAGAKLGGPFTLTGEDGNSVSWSDFDGRYRTIYFGYAYCPDICPTDVQRAMAGLKQFEADNPELGANIQPLFVSVDPARDTPAVLTEFTANFHPRLIGMTGDVETLQSVARAFGTTFSKGEEQPGGGYLMDHFGYTLLFGPEGQPLASLPTDLGPEAVTAELEKWVR